MSQRALYIRKIGSCLFLGLTLIPVFSLLDWYSEYRNLAKDKAISDSLWQVIQNILAGWRDFLIYFGKPALLTVFQWGVVGFIFWLLLTKMEKTDFIKNSLDKIFQLNGRYWCCFLASFVLVVCSTLSYTVQQHLPNNPDSVTQFFQAKIFSTGRLYIKTPPFMEFFYEIYNLEQNGRLFSMFGPGYSLELLLGLLVGIPWIINPLNGALSVILTYLIGRELFGEKTGKAASLILASSPFFLSLNSTFMNNSLSFLLFDIFLYLFILSFRRDDIKTPLLAGLALGGIGFFRPLAAVSLAVPFGGYAIWLLFNNFKKVSKPVGLMLLSLTFCFACRLFYNNIQYGGPFISGYQLNDKLNRGDHDLVVYGFGKHFWGGVHTPAKGFLNIVKQLNRLNFTLLGWPIPGFLFMCLLFFLSRGLDTWDKLMIATLGSLLFFHFFHYWFMDRYIFCSFSIISIMTVRGIAQFIEWLKGRSKGVGGIESKVAFLATGFMLFGFTKSILPRIIYPTGPQVQLIANTVKKAKLGKPALVFVEGGSENMWTYMQAFVHNSPTWDDHVLYPTDLGDDKNKELMTYFPDRLYFRFQRGENGSGKLIPLTPRIP